MIKRLQLSVALVAFGFCGAFAQNLPLDPSVRTGKLPNGFTYYIKHNEEPKDRVVLYLANKIGSILETDEQQGLAHFMEHMSFNGTTHFPKNALIDYLQKAGVRFGADINAYTSFDETVYQLPLPTDNPEVLKNGIQIMRDWAQEAALETSEIDKERGVILEEKRLGKGAKERMQTQYWPVILNGSRYANRLPIGTDEVLMSFKPETIRSFYKDWYRPDLQALIVVGDINVDEMEKTIKAKFSDLKNPANEKARTKYDVALTGKNQFIAVTDKEMTSTVAQVIIKSPEAELKTAADYRKAIVESLFNQMLGERYGELAQKPNPAYLQGSANAGEFIGGLNAYTATVVARPGKGELEKGFKAVWRETVRAKKFGFTEAELNRAKTSYQNSMEAGYKERDKAPSEGFVKEYLQYFLKGNAAPGIDVEYKLVQKELPGITLADVNAVGTAYIKNTDRDILVMAPDKDKADLPNEATLLSWIAAVEAEDLKPLTEESNAKPLLAKKPVKGKIVAEKKDAELNITTLTLSNGIKVVLKPTDYKNNEVIFSGFAPGGTSLYADKDYQSAANASGIIASFGIGNYSITELSKFLTGKQLSVKASISERNQSVGGGATPKDLPLALELMYAYFTEPRKDQAQFESIISRSKAGLANRGNDPNSVFQDTAAAVMSNYNIRRTGPTLAKLDQINLDRVYEIYKERFADAGGFTFTFVGSFTVDSIKPLIEQYIASLPSTKNVVKAKDLGIQIPAGKISKTVYKGTEPKATVQLIFSGPFEYNLANNIELQSLKEALEIRLLERLREEEGGVYTPSAQAGSSKFPQPRYTMGISFGCSPANVDKLIASALDEVNTLRTVGPPQVNVDKLKAEERRQRETSVKTNEYWIGYLNGCLQNGDDFSLRKSYDGLLDKVSPASLKAFAQKYLSGKNLITLVLLPEAGTAKSK
ncbi:insulinase family protein [Pedobacter sp. MC2016-14]|uniref:M16 family metallopeptidase n=1 Tax=Pedobacter sp. MC2016-14 TaxID=2897327 RepID=UPI001E580437|nr:M16 family metallopeptidase [Pedobacter sp. MC2016-14]MCD0489231.1 insulinase family protein [Pedobacter sp. MC2016-14]